ncbi:MAG TPA: molybdopterin-dependent oxidoreductase [Acidimicrobiales bacterium]
MELVQERGTPIGRRVILAMLGLGGAGVLFGSAAQRVLARLGTPAFLPGSNRFRIYSVVGYLPERSAGAYRLAVTGLVDNPLTLSFADLQAMPATRMVKDFQCVTGWRVTGVTWTGVKLADVLDAAHVKAEGHAITFKSFDGEYTESLTMEQARRDDVIVAYAMENGPVSAEHGGPVRMYVAPMYGYKSTKWLQEIEVVRAVDPGYWEVRGYDVDGWVGKSNGRGDRPTS